MIIKLLKVAVTVLFILAMFVATGYTPAEACGYEEPEKIEIKIIGVK